MNVEEIKLKIKLALDAVDELEGPYKLEAFKIVLQHSILGTKKSDESFDDTQTGGSQLEEYNGKDATNPLLDLAKKCNVSLQELKNVFDYENDEFILLKQLELPSVTEKQVAACQIVVTAWMKGKNVEWISGSILHELVEKNSLGDVTNISKNLKKSGLFRKKGKLKGTVYSLTTNGWQEGLKLLEKLAKGN